MTFDDAGLDSRVRAGDYFLSSGEHLQLKPGQRLVLDPFTGGAAGTACFIWKPADLGSGLAARLFGRAFSFRATTTMQPA